MCLGGYTPSDDKLTVQKDERRAEAFQRWLDGRPSFPPYKMLPPSEAMALREAFEAGWDAR